MVQKHSQFELTDSVTVRCRLPMENFRKAVAMPTEVIRNNYAGFLFDAAPEGLYIQFCAPCDWDRASDLIIVLACRLEALETADDKIDWETVITSLADHENTIGAATQTPGVEHDIVGDIAAGMIHSVPIVLDYEHGTCPIAVGDYVSLLISHTANIGNAGYVAGVVVVDICLQYQKDRMGTA